MLFKSRGGLSWRYQQSYYKKRVVSLEKTRRESKNICVTFEIGSRLIVLLKVAAEVSRCCRKLRSFINKTFSLADDNFLLQFLRVRKFNIESTFATFENFFLLRKKYEKWCKIDDASMKKIWELYDLGYVYPLTERDDEGKRIIFVQSKKFDTNKFTSVDAVRLIGVIVITLMEEEETQIAGISTISDFTDVSFSFFNLFSIKDVKDFADFVRNVSVGREKENYFVNLPTVAAFLFEIGRKAMNEKMRKRMITVKNMEQVKTYVDVELLPKEFGGKISEDDMKEDFKKLYKYHEANLEAINDYEIDWDKVETKGSCVVM